MKVSLWWDMALRSEYTVVGVVGHQSEAPSGVSHQRQVQALPTEFSVC